MLCTTQITFNSLKPFYPILKGFTLIELLVVLLIFSLLAGLVVPRLTKMYESWQMSLERDEVLTQLSSLNYLAFQQRIDFTLTHYPPQADTKSDNNKSADTKSDNNKSNDTLNPPLELPAGWQIRTEQPIIFRANGACRGGIVYLEYSEYTFTAQLEPPFCRAKLLN
ncbi:type II secretion system protein [Thioploca ingrica]|uniref:Type II secretion system protein n=1 Tax=Thioploca ingrica TaxID=40754 RepID=A0A090BW81_9GAMM|nr:type II secretion system protein [Thioploca ingrica]